MSTAHTSSLLIVATIWSIYCTKGKVLDHEHFHNFFERLGFPFFTASKIFATLQIWRKNLPNDITEAEMKGIEASCRDRPISVIHSENLQVCRETFSSPVNYRSNALNELLGSSSSVSEASTHSESQGSDHWLSPKSFLSRIV